jgi:pimeloyl-ACP methyl ester carboxylesterase
VAEFVLIPGGWHGGWVFEGVERRLLESGHIVRSVTLSGLGEHAAPTANLSTHVAETIGLLEVSDQSVVLCGHSYGGMVITGAADAVPEKVRALVYLDAYLPADGDSTWSLTTPRFRELFLAGVAENGYACAPPVGLDPRCRPHPIGAFLQAVRLTGAWKRVARKIYVGAYGWEGSPFLDLFKRLQRDPEWTTLSLDCGHSIPRLAPGRAVEVLLAAAG